MDSNTLRRSFIESLLKLRRDTINLDKIGINKKIFLEFDDNPILFDTKLNTLTLNGQPWEPTIEECILFMEKYSEADVRLAMQNLTDTTIQIYSNISAEFLKSKFLTIIDLLKLEENYDIVFEIGSIKIWYDYNNYGFKFNEFDSTPQDFDEVLTTDKLLKSISYQSLLDSLNNLFKQLVRKK